MVAKINCKCFSLGDTMEFLWSPRPSWGQDNNVWKKADVLLAKTDYTSEFRLVIEATVAEGQHGDIGIDDVSFTPGCRSFHNITFMISYFQNLILG